MRILVTGAHSWLGRSIASALSANHEVRALDLASRDGAPALDYVGDPRDPQLAAECTRGCDAIVHLADFASPGAAPVDVLDAATRGTYNLITTAQPGSRFILLSSLRILERYPVKWAVGESWKPEPTTSLDDLAPYLAELTVREVARVRPIKGIALRLGEVVDAEAARTRHPDPCLLHVEDAIQAVQCALAYEPRRGIPHTLNTGWWVFHIPGGGEYTRFPLARAADPAFGYAPVHDLTGGLDGLKGLAAQYSSASPHPNPLPEGEGDDHSRARQAKPRRVVMYGAGAALGAITARVLVQDHILRLTDRRPLADIIADPNKPNPTGPVPHLYDAPHEVAVVDVTDRQAVLDAGRGMDAIINCTVVRDDNHAGAFRVNVGGVYNMMSAAVECGIRRVVHTGPQLILLSHPIDYADDFDVSSDVPPRAGSWVYALSKLLGFEVARIFAEDYGLEAPTLVFAGFRNAADVKPWTKGDGCGFLITWEDAAEGVRLALLALSFPRPFELFNMMADFPNGKFSNEKAKRLLNWQPRHPFDAIWTRSILST